MKEEPVWNCSLRCQVWCPVLLAELSVAVLFVDSCFDCSELRVEESVVVSVVVERMDVVVVRLLVGGVWGIGRRPV